MDIIKHGKYHQQLYKIKCCYCDCEFSYAEGDRHGYAGIPRTAKMYVTCPECARWLSHKYSKKLSCQQ